MILVDFSSIIHRKVATASYEAKPSISKGKYKTSDFSGLMLHYILQDLINIDISYKSEFGELVLVMDDHNKKYWRKNVYPDYKSNRLKSRTESKIDFKEVFEITNEMISTLEKYSPWKCVTVDEAEADDIILVLSRQYNHREKILIYSPDKDLIQAQHNTDNVYQYSSLTQNWLVPENKHDSMEHWLREHIILGDSTDNVPKIVDHCEFSDSFLQHLSNFEIDDEFRNVLEFKYGIKEENNIINLDKKIKYDILSNFNVYKKNRKGEDTILDIYKDIRFGPGTLEKKTKEFGCIENFIDSNPLYRLNYERNKILVMESGIPDYIKVNSLQAFIDAKTDTNKIELNNYLNKYRLNIIKNEIMKILPNEEINEMNCGW